MSITWQGTPLAIPFRVKGTKLCSHCQGSVFGTRLYKILEDSHAKKVPSQTLYVKPASDIYRSHLAGCPWCSTVAQSIRSVADYITERDSEDDDADLDFGNFAISHLDCDAAVHVDISFCRNDESLVFDSLRVHVEVTGIDKTATRLPKIVGDDIIRIDLPLSSNDEASVIFQRHWGRISGDSNHWKPSATKWLSECHQNHQCKTAGTFYPTRLIDVNDPSVPHLIKSENLNTTEQHPYTTLSYVWGTVQKYVLTTANLTDLQMGVDPSLLPKTINDAMHVSRQLGFRYIWIDALCIIQDSPNDKSAELPQMANIYSHSALTIFAARSNGSDEGFLKPSELDVGGMFQVIEIPISRLTGDAATISLGGVIDWNSLENPIYTRAWTLQEELLSPRLLMFEKSSVSWQCVSHRMTYKGVSTYPQYPLQTPLLSLCRSIEADTELTLHTRWHQALLNYTQRNLGFLSDKLNAVSAVAAEIAQSTGWDYWAGLWKEQVVEDLLWSYLHPKEGWKLVPEDYPILRSDRAKAAGYLGPSWSWASVADGPILTTDAGGDRRSFEFEVLTCKLEYAGFGIFGSVTSGMLKISAKAVTLSFRPIFRPDQMSTADIELITSANTLENVGYGVTDALDAAMPLDERLLCMAVAKQTIFDRAVIEGLMLRAIGQGTFVRVGFFRIHDLSIFDNAAKQILTLV